MGGAGLRQPHTSRGSRVASGEACRHWVRILALSLARWVALGASYLISPRPAGGLASALRELFGLQLPCGCGTWSLTFPSVPAVPHCCSKTPLPYSVLWRLTPVTTALPTSFRWGLDNRRPLAAVCSDSMPYQQPGGPALPTRSGHYPLHLQAGEREGLPAAVASNASPAMLPCAFVNHHLSDCPC